MEVALGSVARALDLLRRHPEQASPRDPETPSSSPPSSPQPASPWEGLSARD